MPPWTAAGDIQCGKLATAEDKTMVPTGINDVPHDLARVIDAVRIREATTRDIKGGECSSRVQESMAPRAAYDLARVIDAVRFRDIEGGEGAPGEEKPMGPTNITEGPYDLAGVIDAERQGDSTAGDLKGGKSIRRGTAVGRPDEEQHAYPGY
jgi:hypothetical protein